MPLALRRKAKFSCYSFLRGETIIGMDAKDITSYSPGYGRGDSNGHYWVHVRGEIDKIGFDR